MSEDSIASDSMSCRTEAHAPCLPPRKRLLAGLKQNGWPSPSSSCAAALAEPPQVTETLAHTSTGKADNLDRNCVDETDRGSLQSLNGAAESLDSHNKSQRKSKRQRVSSPLTMRKSSKKKKKISSEADEHPVDDLIDEVKASPVVDKIKASEKGKDEADVDALVSKISSVVEEHSIALVEGEACVEEKEERVNNANGEAAPGHAIDSKMGTSCGSLLKEEEEVTCNKVRRPSRNPASKIKKESKRVATAGDTGKRRRNPNRQNHRKKEATEHKKHEVQRDKMSQMPLPLADEELARQLHRAMNSSPRIAGCPSHKEERPLLFSSRKRFQGS